MHQPFGDGPDAAAHRFVTLGTRKDLVDDEARQVGIRRDKVEVALDAVPDAFLQRQVRLAEGGQHRLAHQARLLVEDAFEQLLLGPEIVVQHGVRHARRLGDRGRARPGESFVEEFPFGGFQNRLFLVPGRFGHGIVRL